MEVQSQSGLLFKLNEIKFNNIVYLIEQHHAKRGDSGGDGCSMGGKASAQVTAMAVVTAVAMAAARHG